MQVPLSAADKVDAGLNRFMRCRAPSSGRNGPQHNCNRQENKLTILRRRSIPPIAGCRVRGRISTRSAPRSIWRSRVLRQRMPRRGSTRTAVPSGPASRLERRHIDACLKVRARVGAILAPPLSLHWKSPPLWGWEGSPGVTISGAMAPKNDQRSGCPARKLSQGSTYSTSAALLQC